MKYNSTKDPIRIYNEILGGKWRLLILHQLFSQTQRFRDLTQNIEGITPRMLTKELRKLESYNLVEKEVYREVPPRVEYSLTDDGVKLYPLIEHIIQFGESFAYLLENSEESLVMDSQTKNTILKKKIIEKNTSIEPEGTSLPIIDNKPVITNIITKTTLEKFDEEKFIESKVSDNDNKEDIIKENKPIYETTNGPNIAQLDNEIIETSEEIIIKDEVKSEEVPIKKMKTIKKIKIEEPKTAVQLELF